MTDLNVLAQYRQESTTFLILSGIALALSIINNAVVRLLQIKLAEQDRILGGVGSIIISVGLLVISVDPSGMLGRYPFSFVSVWTFIILSIVIGVTAVVFDKSLRVVLQSRAVMEKLPSEKWTLWLPIGITTLGSTTSGVLIAITNSGRYSTIAGFCSVILLLAGGVTLVWTGNIVRGVRNRAIGETRKAQHKLVMIKAFLGGATILGMGVLSLVLSIKNVMSDENWIQQGGNVFIPNNTVNIFVLSALIMTVLNSATIIMSRTKKEENNNTSHNRTLSQLKISTPKSTTTAPSPSAAASA
jgi:hypothetical protein